MTNILVVLLFTLCSNNNSDDCHEQAQQVWVAESTNALSIALEQCELRAVELLQEEPNDYYRCVIENEE